MNKISTEKLLNSFQGSSCPLKKHGFSKEGIDVLENTRPHYLVFPTSQCGFGAVWRRGVLTNKDMTKDSDKGFLRIKT
jgi:hypothetical protein